ncbi:PLP-dependent aminotransferase family protein [Pectobacterium sp. B2J-2]|uniref:aminotransferase-like domain-containing protein n=1 Tax=Pectobacterium sp. B2J-2 TaxID=3385372 RepID=UPI0038FC9A36
MTRTPKKNATAAATIDRSQSTSRTHTLVGQLSGDVVRRIHDGTLAVGARLPSVRRYAQERGVSNETVLRVYDKLVALGYLEARRGAGFFVVSKQPAAKKRHPSISGIPDVSQIKQQLLFNEGCHADLGGGSLPDLWLPHEAIGLALREVSSVPLTGQADPRGYEQLRQQLRLKLLEQGIQTHASQIITTSGAADALHLAVWANFYPGDYVIAEAPGPFIHIDRMMASGLEIVRIPRQSDGPDIEALLAACEKYRPRALFCSSVLQNPSSTSMSPYKAHQILKIAEAFDMLIVDDDSYGDLLPPAASGNVARLAALDQLERVIHIGSFSKTISPSLRSGFLAASPEQIERILMYRAVGAVHGPVLTDLFMHHFLAQDSYRQHCEMLRSQLDTRRNRVRETLLSMGCKINSASSGMFLWASLGDGVDAKEVAQQLASRGILTAPGGVFSMDRAYASHMRFNIAHASMQEDALNTLAEVLGALER